MGGSNLMKREVGLGRDVVWWMSSMLSLERRKG